MLLLASGKLHTGRRLGNLVLMTEARVTLIDAGLAGAVLLGVGLNFLFGCGGPTLWLVSSSSIMA